MAWRPLPIEKAWHANLPERALTVSAAALENRYVNEANGHSAFPHLHPWVSLPGENGRVYLTERDNELVAVTDSGRLYTLDREGRPRDRTALSIAVASRPTFATARDELLIAAGGPIIRFDGRQTRALEGAPESSHVAYVSGYVLALDKNSNSARYSRPEDITDWDVLQVFTAEDKPDPMTALLVEDGNDILIGGPESVEVFQVSGLSQRPFYKRQALGEGVYAPGTLCSTNGNGTWCINRNREFVQLTAGGGRLVSEPIDQLLETAADYSEAWAAQLHVRGQKFLVLVLPNAMTAYGQKGLTLLLDYRKRRWSILNLWDKGLARPVRWPIWSIATTTYGCFAGGENGRIYRLDAGVRSDIQQRSLFRSAHYAASQLVSGADEIYVSNVRIRVNAPRLGGGELRFRARCDNWEWLEPIDDLTRDRDSAWVEFGALGCGRTLQVEYETLAAGDCEVTAIEVDCERA
jgi:hypothetical protein